ncbi:MAG: hypothetical protein IMF10_06730, partial [Proteobacteria bacterium]|nr:hypothetical protein [Pseudomonadota bacterium]
EKYIADQNHAVKYILALAVCIHIRKEGEEESNTQHNHDVLQGKPGVEEVEPSADKQYEKNDSTCHVSFISADLSALNF